jgi:hypothetical protein
MPGAHDSIIPPPNPFCRETLERSDDWPRATNSEKLSLRALTLSQGFTCRACPCRCVSNRHARRSETQKLQQVDTLHFQPLAFFFFKEFFKKDFRY